MPFPRAEDTVAGSVEMTDGSERQPPSAEASLSRPRWLAALSPRRVAAVAVGWLVLAWTLVIASDALDLLGWREQLHEPLWRTLFANRRPTEWLQWAALAGAYGGAAALGATVRDRGQVALARFLTWFGIGAALMLIEDAGDVRHTVALYVRRVTGDDPILGLHPATWVDVPYFALLAAPLLYALLRGGHAVWAAPAARPYLLGGYGLYGLAALGSGLSGVGGGHDPASVFAGSLYERLGRGPAELLPADMHVRTGMDPAELRFHLVDGPVEESVELLGAACFLALVLALARTQLPEWARADGHD